MICINVRVPETAVNAFLCCILVYRAKNRLVPAYATSEFLSLNFFPLYAKHCSTLHSAGTNQYKLVVPQQSSQFPECWFLAWLLGTHYQTILPWILQAILPCGTHRRCCSIKDTTIFSKSPMHSERI